MCVAAAHAASFLWVVILYWKSIHDAQHAYLIGFPVPTAFMLILLGIGPSLIVILYMATFHSWVFPAEDFDRFQHLVAERRRQAN